MRKGLVAGIVGIGLLAGCVSPERAARMQANAEAKRTAQLSGYAQTCKNDYGHVQGTPELAQCVQLIDNEEQRLRREGMQALGQALESGFSRQTTTCNTTYGGGFANTNCY